MLTSARNFVANNTHGIIPSLNVFLNNFARTALESIIAFGFADMCHKTNKTIGYPLGLTLGCILSCNLLNSNAYAFITKAGADSVKNGFDVRSNLYNTSLSTWLASNILIAGIGLAIQTYTHSASIFILRNGSKDGQDVENAKEIFSQLLGITVATFAKGIVSRSETFQNIVSQVRR